MPPQKFCNTLKLQKREKWLAVARCGNKCDCAECKLPKNNKRFYWHAAYIVLAACYLASNEKNLTFFPLFTFVAPTLIDLVSGEVNHILAKTIRIAYIILNSIAVLFCFLGWCGFLNDVGASFLINGDSLIGAGLVVPKECVFYAAVFNAAVPIMYSVVTPSQENCVQAIRKEAAK